MAESRQEIIGNRYRVLRRIGEGGMAFVYSAIDETLGRKVAVKVLHAHMTSNADIRNRFRQEARVVSQLDHQNIVKVYDFSGIETDELWIVTEFVEGKTLGKLLAESPNRQLELFEASRIVRDICQALEVAHKNGMVHRDIKPENIMVTTESQVKLMDFGIAKSLQQSNMTQTGTFMGSPCYMSPEQVRTEDVDHRSDLYSLAVLYYEILTGHVPFDGNSTHDVIFKILEGHFDRPQLHRPDLPDYVETFINQGMAIRREDRLQSAKVMSKRLNKLMEKLDKTRVITPVRKEVENSLKDVKTHIQVPEEFKKTQQLNATEVEQLKPSPSAPISAQVQNFERKNPQFDRRNSHSPHAQKARFPNNRRRAPQKSGNFFTRVFSIFVVLTLATYSILTAMRVQLPYKSNAWAIQKIVEFREGLKAPKQKEEPSLKPRVMPKLNSTTEARDQKTFIPIIKPEDVPESVKTDDSKDQKATTKETPRKLARLIVNSQPTAALYVNGRNYGKTNSSNWLQLPPGIHEVRLVRSAYESQSLKVRLRAGEFLRTTQIRLRPIKRYGLILDIKPLPASVVVRTPAGKVFEKFRVQKPMVKKSYPRGRWEFEILTKTGSRKRGLNLPAPYKDPVLQVYLKRGGSK